MYYKLDQTQLLSGPNVEGEGYSLSESNADPVTYPVDGWYWFNTEDEARAFFGLPQVILN